MQIGVASINMGRIPVEVYCFQKNNCARGVLEGSLTDIISKRLFMNNAWQTLFEICVEQGQTAIWKGFRLLIFRLGLILVHGRKGTCPETCVLRLQLHRFT